MTTLTAQVTVDASADKVWPALADFGGIWRFNPSVAASRSLTEANGGVGAERHCDLTFAGASVEERIVEWNDGSDYAIEIFDGEKMPPIKNVIARLGVRANAAGNTVVSGTMTYDTRLGAVGSLMDRAVISRKFGKAFDGIFAGLKHHIETGEVVDTETDLNYAPVAHATV